jgi:hypothetical protein
VNVAPALELAGVSSLTVRNLDYMTRVRKVVAPSVFIIVAGMKNNTGF